MADGSRAQDQRSNPGASGGERGSAVISLVTIESLADAASLQRGRDYFRRGRVLRTTTHANGSVEGVVEGEHFYRVRIAARSFSCDCPMGVSGVFCKHCVAVALAALEAVAPPTGEAGIALDRSSAGFAEAQKQILAGFRTRRDLHDWRAALDYGGFARVSVEHLREAAEIWGAATLLPTVQKAITSTVAVIHRADDSSGVIGDVVRDLLQLHAEFSTTAPPPMAALVAWLIRFQFDGKQDFFSIDVAKYTHALGAKGLERFEDELRALELNRPTPIDGYDYTQRLVHHNLQRLAVARRDEEAIVASHSDLSGAYRLHDLAKALVEIDAIESAISYAERGALVDGGWQAERCAQYWCELLEQRGVAGEALAARQLVFDRWPTSSNAMRLAGAAGDAWAAIEEATFRALEERHPRELIETLLGLGLAERAWTEAQRFRLDDLLWTRLVASREKADPASVVPVLRQLIDVDLETADARNYKSAVKRLKQLRAALRATSREQEFDEIVATLREEHRRRPRLLEEFRKGGFPAQG